jgi:hypothetical protein
MEILKKKKKRLENLIGYASIIKISGIDIDTILTFTEMKDGFVN